MVISKCPIPSKTFKKTRGSFMIFKLIKKNVYFISFTLDRLVSTNLDCRTSHSKPILYQKKVSSELLFSINLNYFPCNIWSQTCAVLRKQKQNKLQLNCYKVGPFVSMGKTFY